MCVPYFIDRNAKSNSSTPPPPLASYIQVFCEDPELYRRNDDAGLEQPIGPELDPGEGRGFPYSELCVPYPWITQDPGNEKQKEQLTSL